VTGGWVRLVNGNRCFADSRLRRLGRSYYHPLKTGLTPRTLDALAKPAIPPTHGLRDKVQHVDTVFSLGYWKPVPKFRFGSSDNAFGTSGAGGSFGFADPDTGIGIAYAMNRLGFHVWSRSEGTRTRQVLSMTSSGRGRKPNLHSKRQSDEQIGAPRDVARM
jgi:CubicO group peptidase (beta-lactamase class C family)